MTEMLDAGSETAPRPSPDGLAQSRQSSLVHASLKLLKEFSVVVLGVVVALALDSYVEARREQRLETGYLERLAGDIKANQAELQRYVNYWNYTATHAERFLAFIDVGGPAERPIDLLIASVISAAISLPNLSTPTYNELIGSATLGIIRDPDTRQALVEYQRTLTFGDPFIERLERARDFDALVHQVVPAHLLLYINAECRRGAACSPPVTPREAQGYIDRIRSAPNARGALNWRLYDAARLAEIFTERMRDGEATLERLRVLTER